jgi:hypothetical protein
LAEYVIVQFMPPRVEVTNPPEVLPVAKIVRWYRFGALLESSTWGSVGFSSQA